MRQPDMVSLGKLPLPGAHITTLTSLANFRPGHAYQSHASEPGSVHGDADASSQPSAEYSCGSDVDTDDLEAAFDDRQALNLKEANRAYDTAMLRAASEENRTSFRPHWPDDPIHASHASFDDWATNTPHTNGTAGTLTSHGSFSFASYSQLASTNSEKDCEQKVPIPWPASPQEGSVTESNNCSDVHAVQKTFQQFLQRAGLDSHLEVRAISGGASTSHCKHNVSVQNLLPCGMCMKIHLN